MEPQTLLGEGGFEAQRHASLARLEWAGGLLFFFYISFFIFALPVLLIFVCKSYWPCTLMCPHAPRRRSQAEEEEVGGGKHQRVSNKDSDLAGVKR